MQARNTIRIASLAVIFGLATGCATTAQLDEIRGMAQNAQSAATKAQQTADQANQTATAAKQTADEAMQSAQKANECCKTTNEKIERMFKKSMQK